LSKYIEILRNFSHQYASKWLVLLFDLCMVLFTFFLAYIIRYNFEIVFDITDFFKQVPFVIVAAIISFLIVNSHKGVVRFTGAKDVINLIIGINILATLLITATFLSRQLNFDSVFDIPGSIIYIHLLLNIFFLVGSRFFIKSVYMGIVTNDVEKQKSALIYGAGTSGMITYDAVTSDPKSNIKVVGFIDDNESKAGKIINLLKVYEPGQITKEFIEKNEIAEVIISIQKIDSNRLLQITSKLFSLNLKVKIVPAVKNWIDGDLSIGQIQDLNLEDLLGREPININNPMLAEEYNNKIIFVTGAAGSIGSELVRKLSRYQFKKLILIDNAESGLYDVQQELIRSGIKNIEAIVSDVRNKIRMNLIFDQYKPDMLFHAAAYKHVPLMEQNPYEAVSVNVRGTKNLIDLSIKYGVNKFILISTDKAVNPTNVMGATKRIAEMIVSCQNTASLGNTKFVITRFGNVLGSNGSVIPLFKKQIESGGPLTVTHKDIIRYFMTIPEAAQLVIEAAAMGQGQEIFVFDMGEPVKIFDLAVNMITLSGLRYPEDINIRITGLRPGEKIYEELLIDGENTKPTYNEKIMIAKCKEVDMPDVGLYIDELCQLGPNTQNIEIVSKIKNIVKEYKPNNTKYDVLNIEL